MACGTWVPLSYTNMREVIRQTDEFQRVLKDMMQQDRLHGSFRAALQRLIDSCRNRVTGLDAFCEENAEETWVWAVEQQRARLDRAAAAAEAYLYDAAGVPASPLSSPASSPRSVSGGSFSPALWVREALDKSQLDRSRTLSDSMSSLPSSTM